MVILYIVHFMKTVMNIQQNSVVIYAQNISDTDVIIVRVFKQAAPYDKINGIRR